MTVQDLEKSAQKWLDDISKGNKLPSYSERFVISFAAQFAYEIATETLEQTKALLSNRHPETSKETK